jgi:hypothetical protein
MALTVPDVGENSLLDMALSDASPAAQELRLYSAVAPAISEATVKANFTEATFTGYVMKSLVRATWGAAAGGSKAYPQQSWSPTSAETIVGYYVLEATALEVLWCEPFAASRSLENGDTLNLDISIDLA